MAGLFGVISSELINRTYISKLVEHSKQRGDGSYGYVKYDGKSYVSLYHKHKVSHLLRSDILTDTSFFIGYSSCPGNEISGEPLSITGDMAIICDGVLLNAEGIQSALGYKGTLLSNADTLSLMIKSFIREGQNIENIGEQIISQCEGIVSAIVCLPVYGKVLLFSNNGSLFYTTDGESAYISSEKFPLENIGNGNVKQIFNACVIYDIPKSNQHILKRFNEIPNNILGSFVGVHSEDKLLKYDKPAIRRCTKCILPETMPFIRFDEHGVCNYCNNHKPLHLNKPKGELFRLLESYRRNGEPDCIVPFSGGRDSSYGLHIIVKELKMRPIAYTYDWGMVTDLATRNVSRMCAELGVENIVVTADIHKKRDNIRKNLTAWLKSPNLGMMSILTAGDKHFFRYLEDVKKQTGISLNLWGVNPMEVTHFKSGFLGIKPSFEQDGVYRKGLSGQLAYQGKRFKAMLKSPGYFNTSLWDTLSGEYYRSVMKKHDYYHIFDYWLWNEQIVDECLDKYGWEKAPDTNTTWRIGDGTAAFYNYVYYSVAGFTEHDTFRSNQIREGHISREKALELVEDENKPRYQYIRWYLDALGMDFIDVIKTVNSIPKLIEKREK